MVEYIYRIQELWIYFNCMTGNQIVQVQITELLATVLCDLLSVHILYVHTSSGTNIGQVYYRAEYRTQYNVSEVSEGSYIEIFCVGFMTSKAKIST